MHSAIKDAAETTASAFEPRRMWIRQRDVATGKASNEQDKGVKPS